MMDALITTETGRRRELGDFLRTRRARLTPGDVGLPDGGRRRTPGLRREEVAMLANVGLSWYVALEQGRDIQPSDAVLQSIAGVLRLTAAERHHLLALVRGHEVASHPIMVETVSLPLQRIVADLDPNPAFIIGQHRDYLAWNQAAILAFDIPGPMTGQYGLNSVWQTFTDPSKRSRYVDWPRAARKIVAEFRADSTSLLGDEWYERFVRELSAVSPEFAELWQRHDVGDHVNGRKEFNHPTLGYLVFDHTLLQLAEQPGLRLMIYTPPSDSPQTKRKLEEALASTSLVSATSLS